MTRTCSQCGWDYTSDMDFERGGSRCWQCAAKDYKKGLERIKARARLGAQTLIEEIGSAGPEDVDTSAERAAAVIRDLRAKVAHRDTLLSDWLSAPPVGSTHDAITIEELEERTEKALKESADGIRHSSVERYSPGDHKPTAVYLSDGTHIRAVHDGVRADGVSVWLEHIRQHDHSPQDDEGDQ